MAIIPVEEKTLFRIYWCPMCQKNWVKKHGYILSACAVKHAPGTCCHHSEREINNAQLKAITADINLILEIK